MPSSNPISIRPVSYELCVRDNLRMRMRARYGTTVVTTPFPLAHLWLTVEGPEGRAIGLAGDCFPPVWYDKRAGRTFEHDLKELSASVSEAAATVLSMAKGGPRSVFDFWRELYQHQLTWARGQNITDMTGNLGTSMVERALIDAAGKLLGKTFHQCVAENVLGLDPGAIHPFLKGWQAKDALAPQPLQKIHIRHTIGGLDPLTAGDVTSEMRLNDGLPQTLEEYVHGNSLRYFKIKLKGDVTEDFERMRLIAAVLDRCIPPSQKYLTTLDGNEQYAEPAALVRFLEKVMGDSKLGRFASSILFVEQPYSRLVALNESIKPDLAAASKFKPLIVDESDENVQAVPRAIELGYGGYAIKSAKGPIKAMLNKGAMLHHPARPKNPVISGEDMGTVPVLPLHTDLVLMAAMGVEHLERNGHHFYRGLDHLSPRERDALLKNHPALYHMKSKDLAALAVESGTLDVRSLNAHPGFGIDGETEVDRESMKPWSEVFP